jgi:hypothetical protein
LEAVDVEAGVDFVEDEDVGLEDESLEDFVFFAFAATKTLVEGSLIESRI